MTKRDGLPPLSGPRYYLVQNNVKGIKAVKFWLKVATYWIVSILRTIWALAIKEAYVGPFKGEFGNFLGHVLPFISFLHKHGVKVHFCGFEIFRPYLVDSNGASIVYKYYPLRDIYSEAPPNTNFGEVPEDLEIDINSFHQKAAKRFAYFDLNIEFYYWFVYRFVVARFFSHAYDLSKYYGVQENACTLFPRSKGAKTSENNGEQWDYSAVAKVLTSAFEKVYVVGHPAHVMEVDEMKGVELIITNDNEKILNAACSSQLIISPHSGVVYLAPLLRKRFLMIYRGGKSIMDIGSIQNTLYYLKSLAGAELIDYCFSLQELKNYVDNHKLK